ncbi:MAG TPA: DUF3182 family protein [Ramlibacter sp.]
MTLHQSSAGWRGAVVTYAPDEHDHASEHERSTHLAFARQLAALRGYEAGGSYEPGRHGASHLYFLPSTTLTTDEASALGIRGVDDLFGGVVPYPFVATKAISHPLVAPDAVAICGWNPAFAPCAGGAVLAGYSVFSLEDARRAGMKLLAQGPVRVKPVRATGGRGQSVARDAAELERSLAAADASELARHGLVLEQDLNQVRTFSVGQVHVADLAASYYGLQRLTRDNRGEEVFGGTELVVARGGFESLLEPDPGPEIRRAIGQARRYDACVASCYPGFFASRRNYDVALGRDAAGHWRSGVLEQSCRAGGATGAELAALEVFRREPGRNRVRTRCVEIFGASPEPPPGATVHFRATDPQVGLLTKYTVVERDVHAH